MTITSARTAPVSNIYECPDCGEQTTERRCSDCHLITRRLGPGGHCPHCDEPVLIADTLGSQRICGPAGAVSRPRPPRSETPVLSSGHSLTSCKDTGPVPAKVYLVLGG